MAAKSADLSACEAFIFLLLPLHVLFMLLLIPSYLVPLRYSLGFLSEFTFRSYIVVVIVLEKPLPFPSLVGTGGGPSGPKLTFVHCVFYFC